MGTEEPEYSARECGVCYAAGKTPTVISIAVTGIKQGDDWAPPDPAPPNGTFLVHQNAVINCWWNELIGGVTLLYKAGGDPGMIRIALQPPGHTAFLQAGIACQKFFENNIVAPGGRHYYGGKVQVWTP